MGTGILFPTGSGTLWGRGQPKFCGFYEGKSPKNLKFRGKDEGNIFGDFAHSISMYMFHSEKPADSNFPPI